MKKVVSVHQPKHRVEQFFCRSDPQSWQLTRNRRPRQCELDPAPRSKIPRGQHSYDRVRNHYSLHSGIHQPQLSGGITCRCRSRQQKTHRLSSQRLQHRIRSPQQRCPANSASHVSPLCGAGTPARESSAISAVKVFYDPFRDTYGSSRLCTVSSTSVSEKYSSLIRSIRPDFTFKAGVDCAFFTICAHATCTGVGMVLYPAL